MRPREPGDRDHDRQFGRDRGAMPDAIVADIQRDRAPSFMRMLPFDAAPEPYLQPPEQRRAAIGGGSAPSMEREDEFEGLGLVCMIHRPRGRHWRLGECDGQKSQRDHALTISGGPHWCRERDVRKG